MFNATIRFYSNCLRRYTTFQMVLPYDERADIHADNSEYRARKTRVLFLLHGYTGDAGNWVPEQLSDKYNFAVVIPNGEKDLPDPDEALDLLGDVYETLRDLCERILAVVGRG